MTKPLSLLTTAAAMCVVAGAAHLGQRHAPPRIARVHCCWEDPSGDLVVPQALCDVCTVAED